MTDMKLLLLTALLAIPGCATRRNCYTQCLHVRKPDQGIQIIRECDNNLHAVIVDGDRMLDPWTLSPYRKPCELLCRIPAKELGE